MKRACIIHDWANLLCLPVLCVMALAGLVDAMDKMYFVYAITSYVGLDTVWVFVQEDAVPSARTAIKVHHIITLLLCSFPFRRPEVAIFACLDGLTEINTCFMIARRQFKSKRQILTAFYWSTFIPVRLVLFPYLLWEFAYNLPQTVPLWERAAIWGCQAFLCIFNVGMTYRSLSGWWRNRQKQRAAAAAASAGAAKEQQPAAQLAPASATAHVVLASSTKLGNKGASQDAATIEQQRRRSSRVAALEAAERSWAEERNPLLGSPARHGLVSVRG